MKLHFLGANRQVTGSRYLLDSGGHQVLVDCGMFQERQFQGRNWDPSPIRPHEIDSVLLTHAHLDHCGLLPKLVREGFRGPIYCTHPTVPLSEIVMRDAAEIQAEEVAYKDRRHAREGRSGPYPNQPLYAAVDVAKTVRRIQGVDYRQVLELTEDLSVVFHDAGHILGSAMIEVQVHEHGKNTRLLFSGDIGQCNKPLIRDPSLFDAADLVVMESTYGNREHEAMSDVADQLARVVRKTAERGGNIVIPTFAVERAQELIYYIGQLVRERRIPDLPVYLDSPMAVDVTEIYREFRNYFDAEAWELIRSQISPLHFPGLRFAHTVEESKAINRLKDPCIIMATSGMCTAGRIKHHLRANLGRPESTVLFVGFQSRGTLGRQILDGSPDVRIHGQSMRVKAEVTQITGFSGHADRVGLLNWIGHLRQPPRHIYLTHGEESAAEHLAAQIREQKGWTVTVPDYRDVIEF